MSNTPINQPKNQPQVPEIAIEVEIPAVKKVLRFSAKDLTRQWNMEPNRSLFWLRDKDLVHKKLNDAARTIADYLKPSKENIYNFRTAWIRVQTELKSLEQSIRPQAFAQQTAKELKSEYKKTARAEALLVLQTAYSPLCNTVKVALGDLSALLPMLSDYMNIAAVCVRAGLSMRRKLDLLLKSIIFWILKHYDLSEPAKAELKQHNLFDPKKVLGFDTLQKISQVLGKEPKHKNVHRERAEAGTLAAFRQLIPGGQFDMIWNTTPDQMANILDALHFRHDKYGRLLALYLKKYGGDDADRDPEKAKKILERRFYDPVLARFITFRHAIEKYNFYKRILPVLDQTVGQLRKNTSSVEYATGTLANLAKSFIPTSSFTGGSMGYLNQVVGYDFKEPLQGVLSVTVAEFDLMFLTKETLEQINSAAEQDERNDFLDAQALADAEGLTKGQCSLEETKSFVVSNWLDYSLRSVNGTTVSGWKIELSSAARVDTRIIIGSQRDGRAQLKQARRDWPIRKS